MRTLAVLCGLFALTACSVRAVTFTPEEDPGQIDHPPVATITATRAGAAMGTVTARGLALSCRETCSTTVPIGTVVTLEATPDEGAVFGGWGIAGCDAAAPTCTLTVTEDVTINARFDVQMIEVVVEMIGSGAGRITSTPSGLACPGTCTWSVPYNTPVELVAATSDDSTFLGWSGACSGTAACTITAKQRVTVMAGFGAKLELVVLRDGTGTGSVSSSPDGIDCGTDCAQRYAPGTVVHLSPTADSDSRFTGWSGACTGTGACDVTVNAAAVVTATFALREHVLTVARAGSGSGTVTSDPAGISCGTDCSKPYRAHTMVQLSAAPAGDSVFGGWSGGGCMGMGTCTVTVEAAVTVTATFTLRTHALTVARAGSGGGTVTSEPAGISCGMDCSEGYPAHTMVQLSAAPASDSTFGGWSGGGCMGTGSCTVTMEAAVTVTATFTLIDHTLTVARAGSGTGTVTSDLAGISCGTDCSEAYPAHTLVRLTAAASSDSTFSGWSGGGCMGTGTCAVTLETAVTVTATFALRTRVLTVARAGSGTGTVSSDPAGILCGQDCSEEYLSQTVVQLTAFANNDSQFTGWSGGGCTGTGVCTITVGADVTVTATFGPRPPFSLLAVANYSNHSVTVHDVTANGNVAPVRVISGAATLLSSPFGLDVAGDLIFVANQSANAITVYPATASGNVAPLRRIAGTATGIGSIANLTVFAGEIYLAQQNTQGGSIAVFPVSADGNVAPTRVITGLGSVVDVAVFGNELYVTDHGGNRVVVLPGNSAGAAVPTRVISGPSTRLNQASGIVVFNGEVYVSNIAGREITVFPQNATGNVAPTRVLGPSSLAGPYEMIRVGNELLVGNFMVANISTFAIGGNGDVAPLRQIAGAATLLSGPLGIAAF